MRVNVGAHGIFCTSILPAVRGGGFAKLVHQNRHIAHFVPRIGIQLDVERCAVVTIQIGGEGIVHIVVDSIQVAQITLFGPGLLASPDPLN